MSLCGLRFALGEPGVGLHRHAGGIALFDVLMTVAAAGLISAAGYDFVMVLFILFLMSLFAHWLFCVPTTIAVGVGLVE